MTDITTQSLESSVAVLEAASAGVRDMADGSLRITLEFDPPHAKAAYALFGARGTPVAVTALKEGYAAKSGEPEKKPEKTHGELCRWAVLRCKDPTFQEWLGVGNEEEAKAFICETCEITSRSELDSNWAAAEKFHTHIRLPFNATAQGRGW